MLKKIILLIIVIFILSPGLTAKNPKSAKKTCDIPAYEMRAPEDPPPADHSFEEFKFKSPGKAFFHTLLWPVWGQGYALNEGQTVFPVSGIILGASLGCALASGGTERNTLLWSSIGLLGSAYMYDFAAGAVIATDNAVKFINHAKKTELNFSNDERSFKDPALAALISLFSAGAGKWYVGDYENIALITVLDILLGYACPILWLNTTQGDSPIHLIPGGLLVAAVPFRFVMLISNIFYTDGINEEYYKQMVCPKSKFRILKKEDPKEPLIALALSAVLGGILPGIGNFYAGNAQASAATFCTGAIGWSTVLITQNMKELDVNAKGFYFGVGAGLIGLSYLYDLVTAPCNVVIHNAVYSGDAGVKTGSLPVFSISPFVSAKEEFGINLTCAF